MEYSAKQSDGQRGVFDARMSSTLAIALRQAPNILGVNEMELHAGRLFGPILFLLYSVALPDLST